MPENYSIRPLQNELETTGRISLKGQQELRSVLQTMSEDASEIKRDLIKILNPREARLITLSDKEFESQYFVVTQDNYSKYSDEKCNDVETPFDCTHGFYVRRLFKPL